MYFLVGISVDGTFANKAARVKTSPKFRLITSARLKQVRGSDEEFGPIRRI
ncbi:MAG: hypothetical protein WA667_18700 [Candidatus Nitrosopolaris sp.]